MQILQSDVLDMHDVAKLKCCMYLVMTQRMSVIYCIFTVLSIYCDVKIASNHLYLG